MHAVVATVRVDDSGAARVALADLRHSLVPLAPKFVRGARWTLVELGVPLRVQVTTEGWLPLPFVVAGTDLVAVVPERLARRVAGTAGVVVAEPPFGKIDLIEAVWWHPTRSGDQAPHWLRSSVAGVAARL